MNASFRQLSIALGAVVLLLIGVWSGGGLRNRPSPARLAVALVAVENNPGHPRARAPTVLNGVTGLCAIFAVTNVAKGPSIWFDTAAVEERVGPGWRRRVVPPYPLRQQVHAEGGKPWWGIASHNAGREFSPGTGMHFVVEWPREVPTNSSWRLELQCGPEPSPTARKWDDKLGVHLFARQKTSGLVYTPEVRQ